jgi:hypothetical protein
MDEVWVPTKFQAEVFEQNGVDPSKIVLMPEAVDVDFFNPEDMKMLDLDKFAKFYEEDLVEKFRFMSVFKVSRDQIRILLQINLSHIANFNIKL